MIIEIIFIIVIVLILLINILIRSVAKTCKGLENASKLSGMEIARILSSKLSNEEPHIIKKSGRFLDHYNRERNVIKLSPEVFDGEDMYAATMAINVALETDKERRNVSLGRKINSFLVIASYVMIVIGAFAQNNLIIHLGMILFIITFIIEFVLLASLFKTEEDLNNLYKLIKKEKLVKPIEDYKENGLLVALSRLATLPYNFINYFR